MKLPRTKAIESLAKEKEKENDLKKAELKLKKDKLKFEKKTKDRADVSLKEYEELKKELERYRALYRERDEAIKIILRPLKMNHVSDDIISKILECRFGVIVKTTDDVESMERRIAVIYKVDMSELL